jgi:hypothetical protein
MKLKNVFPIMAMLSIVLLSACDKDDDEPGVRPTVASTDPANNATNFSISAKISATFSVAMDPTTVTTTNFTVQKNATTMVSGTTEYSGTTATFTPSQNLQPNTLYTATITKGVLNKNKLSLTESLVWSFTTGAIPDVTLPTATLTDPLNNGTGVARNTALAITFSEAMDPLTINTSTFVVTQGSTAVSGTVTYSGTTATFTPAAVLGAALAYTAKIKTGAKDLAGNALAADIVWNFTTGGTTASLAAVNLGLAANYVILAKTAINNNPGSAITGDLGLSPAATSYITGFALTNATGFATSTQVTGKLYAADMADPTPINMTTAVNNMITAYNDAAGRPTPDFLELGTGNIGGKTLTPGLYKWTTTVTLPSDVVISGGVNDVWIFQISNNLTMSSAVKMTLSGGAQAKNIFWQVAGQVTVGTTAHVEGILMSMTGITFQTGASINGRALAQTAVILDGNAVTKPQ